MMASSAGITCLTFCCTCKTTSYHHDYLQKELGSLKPSWRFWQILTWLTCFSLSRQRMNILAVWCMFRFSFKMLPAQLNGFPKMFIMVLLFLKINSFSWSTISSVLLNDECHKHLKSSTEVTPLFNFETQSKTAFFKLSAY